MAQHQPQLQAKPSHPVVKATTAATVGTSLTVLSALTLAATVILLVVATPLLVIFSPVLVPAAIVIFLILAGFFTSGGLGATATFLLYWTYVYVTGKRPIGTDQLDRVRAGIQEAARVTKETVEQVGKQVQKQTRGGQAT